MSATKCSRCGGKIHDDWSEQWPVYCFIQIGRHSRIFDVVTDGDWSKAEDHPAVEGCDAQEMRIRYHNQALPPAEWSGVSEDVDSGVSGASDGVFGGGGYHVGWDRHNADADKFRESKYHLCGGCHDSLIRLIGGFFGLRGGDDE